MRVQPSADSIDTADNLLRQLEKLINRLLARKFGRSQDLWKLQVDLLKILQITQRSINKAKRDLKSTSAARGELASLRYTRASCRLFGDSIAWVLMGMDRGAITALGANSPVPIPLEEHGTTGMVVAAQILSSQGWGFPILHDITDCLRVGDVTFVTADGPTRTVEIKTRLKGTRIDGKREVRNYLVQAVFHNKNDTLPAIVVGSGDLSSHSTHFSNYPTERVKRQLDRMSDAHARQSAAIGTMVKTSTGPVYIAGSVQLQAGYFHVVERVLRRARRSGYAGEYAGDGFYYAAIYNEAGVSPDVVANLSQLPDDIVSSGMLYADPGRNGVQMYTIPPVDTGRSALPHMPYFLQSFPRSTIIDFLHGRMILVILVNTGRVSTALQEAGFNLSINRDDAIWHSGPLVVRRTFVDNYQLERYVQISDLRYHLVETIYEFQPLDYLVDVAQCMASAAEESMELRNGLG